jgi:hypothetical protein
MAERVIAAHLAALAAALPRRGHWTRALLAEARDGLADAAAAYRAAGLGAGAAAARAVADFGPVAAVAPDFRAEIALRQARRTSRLLCALLLPPLVGWPALLVRARPPRGSALLAGHLAGVAGLAVLVAAVALVGTGRAGVPAVLRVRLPALVGYAAVVGGPAVAVGAAAVAAHLPLSEPGPAALTVATVLGTGGVAWSGALCRRAARLS